MPKVTAKKTEQKKAEPKQTADVPQEGQTAEDPRVAELKLALEPFTKITAEERFKDDAVIIVRGVSITAGDVRRAVEAMKL